MPDMPAQNYQNHVRRVPGFLALIGIEFLTMIGAGVNLSHSLDDHQRLYSASLILVLAVCLLFATFFARVYPLKAQDRAIRAEENLRHFVLTGKLLDARLTTGQIAAVRFACDAEFAALAARAAAENIAPKDIKQAVKNWRADYHRV
ncbi:MAG: DUF6526 family protein [Candidatus Solibacter sp.]